MLIHQQTTACGDSSPASKVELWYTYRWHGRVRLISGRFLAICAVMSVAKCLTARNRGCQAAGHGPHNNRLLCRPGLPHFTCRLYIQHETNVLRLLLTLWRWVLIIYFTNKNTKYTIKSYRWNLFTAIIKEDNYSLYVSWNVFCLRPQEKTL